MEGIRIGLIGCGRIAASHFAAIRDNRILRLQAVCDSVEERVRAAAAEHQVAGYRDYREMLDREKLDLVSICTPTGLHAEMGVAAAERNVNVLVEKPIATNLADADRLIKACAARNLKLFVVKQNRLNPTIQVLKQAVDKGRFGRIFLINSTVRWNRTQEYYDSAPWRGTRALDGGAFLNQASHYVDVVQWLGGPVKSVSAVTRTQNHRIEMEDTGAAWLEFANGALGTLEATMCTYRRNWEGSITVIGEEGTAKVGGTAVNRIEYWDFARYEDEDKRISEYSYQPLTVYGSGHFDYYRKMVEAFFNDNAIEVDGREARKSLAIIMAIYESAATGRVQNLADY